jgi:hypothetical protein
MKTTEKMIRRKRVTNIIARSRALEPIATVLVDAGKD